MSKSYSESTLLYINSCSVEIFCLLQSPLITNMRRIIAFVVMVAICAFFLLSSSKEENLDWYGADEKSLWALHWFTFASGASIYLVYKLYRLLCFVVVQFRSLYRAIVRKFQSLHEVVDRQLQAILQLLSQANLQRLLLSIKDAIRSTFRKRKRRSRPRLVIKQYQLPRYGSLKIIAERQ